MRQALGGGIVVACAEPACASSSVGWDWSPMAGGVHLEVRACTVAAAVGGH